MEKVSKSGEMALAGPIVTVVVVLPVVPLGPPTGTRLSEIMMTTIRKHRKPGGVQNKFPEIASKHLETKDPEDSRPVVIIAQDEGGFVRISDSHRCWVPPGIRPKASKQVVREYLYAYAAVCPASGKMTSLILPYANTDN